MVTIKAFPESQPVCLSGHTSPSHILGEVGYVWSDQDWSHGVTYDSHVK